MANEASPVEGPYETHDFTVASGTAIVKGTICKLTDPRTASASSSADVFAGIAATGKSATDYSVELGLHTKGTFLMTNTGEALSAGGIVSLSGTNLIKQATEAEMVTGAAFGKVLQDAAASEEVEVKIGSIA